MMENQNFVDASTLPNVFIRDGEPYATVGGKAYRVIAAVRRGDALIPVLDIPMIEEHTAAEESRKERTA